MSKIGQIAFFKHFIAKHESEPLKFSVSYLESALKNAK
jgi:hypothetical protein